MIDMSGDCELELEDVTFENGSVGAGSNTADTLKLSFLDAEDSDSDDDDDGWS